MWHIHLDGERGQGRHERNDPGRNQGLMPTVDLIQRLQRKETGEEERRSLEALSKEMIKIFKDERRTSDAPEAAALAPVCTVDSYQDLARAFGNAIIDGTADGSILGASGLERVHVRPPLRRQHQKGGHAAGARHAQPAGAAPVSRRRGRTRHPASYHRYPIFCLGCHE